MWCISVSTSEVLGFSESLTFAISHRQEFNFFLSYFPIIFSSVIIMEIYYFKMCGAVSFAQL